MMRALVTGAVAMAMMSAFSAQDLKPSGPRAPTSSGLHASKPPSFSPIQPDLLGAGGALVNGFADYDGDGDLDLFVGFDGKPNRLYRNDKGTFVDVAKAAGVADARPTRAAAWADVDADGDPDLLLGFTPGPAGPVLRLYRNDGGTFVDQTTAAGLVVATGAVRQPAFVDVDGDGDLDLFVGFRDRPNALYRNDAGHFTEIAASVGLADPRKTVGAAWFDMDQDGDLDLAVANMDGDANGLFRNDKGMFTDVAGSAGVQWGGRGQTTRTTARSACVPPTWMATADSISSRPTTGRWAFSATAAPDASRIGPPRGASRSTRGTTRARRPTSTTTGGSISTSTARSPAAPAGRIRCSTTPARRSRT